MIFYAASDCGKKRENNEDYYLIKKIFDNIYLFIVADGLGGYQSGEVASKVASDYIASYFVDNYKLNKEDNAKDILKQAIVMANKKIYNMQKTKDKYKNMATTVAILCVDNDKMYYASVGDSRIYSIDDKFTKLAQITEDDTYVNALLKTRIINEEEALNHPQKHMLTKAVGIFNKIDIEVHTLESNYDGFILMCTDGVTNMLNKNDILNIFRKNKIENIANKIVEKANERGGVDNITAIVIKL